MSVIVTGHSDDLIEIDGDLREEFSVYDTPDGGHRLSFSDGTILRIEYAVPGVWRINPVVIAPTTAFHETYAPADDEDNYTDRVELIPVGEPIAWVKLNAEAAA